jgi:hypothetical protein
LIKKLEKENLESLYPEFYEDTEILKQNALAMINKSDQEKMLDITGTEADSGEEIFRERMLQKT